MPRNKPSGYTCANEGGAHYISLVLYWTSLEGLAPELHECYLLLSFPVTQRFLDVEPPKPYVLCLTFVLCLFLDVGLFGEQTEITATAVRTLVRSVCGN